MSGHADFTVGDVIALEDASGRFPVTKLLARRLEGRGCEKSGSLIAQSSVIAKECGEALSAILSAEQSSSADQEADAIKEIDEAIEVLKAARALLEGRDDG